MLNPSWENFAKTSGAYSNRDSSSISDNGYYGNCTIAISRRIAIYI